MGGPLQDHFPELQTKSNDSQCLSNTVEDAELTYIVKKWWDMESYGTRITVDGRSKEDQKAITILNDKTEFDGERYVVHMLWADPEANLPNNYYAALKQFESLEKRLQKDPNLRDSYSDTIQKDLELGYIRRISQKELDDTSSKRQWYLPHHPVLNPNKPGKIRRVCNAASEYRGTSLKKQLMIGPDLLQNLLGIIFRFRQGEIALSSDIEAMFLQIKVPKNDARCLRFIWRNEESKKLEIMEYTRHIFGAKSSPTCANFALHRAATDNAEEFPQASSMVTRNFYVDDFLQSSDSIEIARNVKNTMVELLKRGGFTLSKWVSNEPQLCDKIIWDEDESISTLGILWKFKIDTLQLCRGFGKEARNPVTHRQVLSMASSLFDPMGIAAPFTIRVRLVLRKIWQQHGK